MLKKRSAITVFMTCIITSSCSLHLFRWSTQEVAWFSFLIFLLTCWMLHSANRTTLHLAGAPSPCIGPILCLSGLFFLVLGSKLNLIHAFGSDVPFWDQWPFEGLLFPSVLKSAMNPSILFAPHNEHRPLLTRLLDITLLKLNGQWDPVVEMFVSSILYSLLLTGFCLVVWRLAGRRNLPVFCIIIGIIGVRHFSWECTLWSMTVGFYFLLGFSFIAIVLLLYSRPFTIGWHLGLAASLLGQFSVPSGFFAPIAVACVMLFNCISGTIDRKKSSLAIFVLIAAAILELQLAAVSTGAVFKKFDLIDTLRVFGNIAAWPAFYWCLAPIFWCPFSCLSGSNFAPGGLRL